MERSSVTVVVVTVTHSLLVLCIAVISIVVCVVVKRRQIKKRILTSDLNMSQHSTIRAATLNILATSTRTSLHHVRSN